MRGGIDVVVRKGHLAGRVGSELSRVSDIRGSNKRRLEKARNKMGGQKEPVMYPSEAC